MPPTVASPRPVRPLARPGAAAPRPLRAPVRLAARLLLILLLPCVFLLAAWPAPAAAAPAVAGVRVGAHPDRTRIVLDVTEPVPFRVHLLERPDRLVIDLPEVGWRAGEPRPPAGIDLVTGFHYGRFQPGTWRVVVGLRRPVEVVGTMRLPPLAPGGDHRLVIDVAPRAATAAAPPPPAAAAVDRAARAERVPLPPTAVATPKLKPVTGATPVGFQKPVIVLDPGHGGRDAGAVGRSGTLEKDVVLAVARDLRDRLVATGRYEVVLTRTDDTYVGLHERLEVARGAGASAFLSIHADSLEQTTLRGASVYTLSDTASDKEAEALAQKHNKAAILNGVDLSAHDPEVQRILIDLAQRDTNNRSIDLASGVAVELGRATAMLRRDRRHGGFVVLKSPDVPSVLVELGFLSNPEDERNLRDAAHRAGLAGALLRALDRFIFPQQPS